MKKRILSCILVCLFMGAIVFAASGCTAPQKILTPTNTLTVYFPPMAEGSEFVSALLRMSVGAFRRQYPDVNVITTDFNDDQDPEEAYRIYLEKLKTELTAGKGPDFVCIKASEFDDLQKTMGSGIFFDLNQAIAQDPSFSLDEYIPSLMHVCHRGDALPLLPVDYVSPILLTSEEALKINGFSLPAGGTFDNFLTSLKQYYTREDALWPMNNSDPQGFLNLLLEFGGVSILDYEKDAVTLDTPVFRKVAETYKLIYARASTMSKAELEAASMRGAEFPLNSKALLNEPTNGGGIIMWDLDVVLAEQTPVLYPIPSADGSSSPGMLKPRYLAGIMQSSPNKLNSFRLLKIMLSKPMQTPKVNLYQVHTIRLDTLAEFLDYSSNTTLSNAYGLGHGIGVSSETVAKAKADILQQTQELLTNAPATLGLSEAVKDILWKEMEPYFQGSRSLDEAIASAQEKLKLYMGE